MDDANRSPLAAQDPTLLFEEYLTAIDAGEKVEVDEFVRRAGDRAAELRRRLHVYAALQELSDTLQPRPDAETGETDRAPAPEAPLRQLGRFRDLVQIGHGGSSRVLSAYDPKLARRVALKVFSPRELGVRDARSWMQNEGRSLARLEHAGVVRVFDVDEADGHAYIAMEYVQGPSLRDVIDLLKSRANSGAQAPDSADVLSSGHGSAHTDVEMSETAAVESTDARNAERTPSHTHALPPEAIGATGPLTQGSAGADTDTTGAALGAAARMAEWTKASARALEGLPARVRLALKLARALQYCHTQGVIHRDVKPGNILLVEASLPKLIDFGLAHTSSDEASHNQVTQRLVGTPSYLAPEQVDGIRTGASPASDQFALGIVIYELLTLTNPFQKETRDETLRSISRAAPEPLRKSNPAVPSDLELIVAHCLQRLPKDRYDSVGQLADDIDAFVNLRAISLEPPSPLKLARLWVARHRRDVVLGGLFLVIASILALWVLDARARRAVLSEEMSAEAARIAELRTPAEFATAYPVTYWMERTAHDLDREAGASIVGNELEHQAHALVDACSRRLAEMLARSWQELAQADSFQQRDGARKIMTDWSGVLGMDMTYCPECRYNDRDRQRGRVDFPTVAAGQTLRVLRYEPLNSPMFSALSPVDSKESPLPGLYRCQISDSSGRLLREADFEASMLDERQALELREVRLEIRRGMLRAEKSSFKHGPTTLDVLPFWIMSGPVRWRDLALVYPPAQVSRVKASAEQCLKASYDDDGPAILSYQEAQAFARAVGARIPTVEELVVAWRDLGAKPDNMENLAAGELVTGLVVNGDRTVVRYSAVDSNKRIAPNGFSQVREFGTMPMMPTHDGRMSGYTFRLAFSDRPASTCGHEIDAHR